MFGNCEISHFIFQKKKQNTQKNCKPTKTKKKQKQKQKKLHTHTIGKLLSPLGTEHISNIFCIGLNYKQHAAESNMEVPKNPVIFMKPTTSLCGPNDPILVHTSCQKAYEGLGEVDYEVELVIVIGKKCKDVTESDALNYVLGYTVANDVSARNWQLNKDLAGHLF